MGSRKFERVFGAPLRKNWSGTLQGQPGTGCSSHDEEETAGSVMELLMTGSAGLEQDAPRTDWIRMIQLRGRGVPQDA
jgi:hypothetical protein